MRNTPLLVFRRQWCYLDPFYLTPLLAKAGNWGDDECSQADLFGESFQSVSGTHADVGAVTLYTHLEGIYKPESDMLAY